MLLFPEATWDSLLALFIELHTSRLNWVAFMATPKQKIIFLLIHSDTTLALSYEAMCVKLTNTWDPQDTLNVWILRDYNQCWGKKREIGWPVGHELKDLPFVSCFCRTQAFYPFSSLFPKGSGTVSLGFSASKPRICKAHFCLLPCSDWSQVGGAITIISGNVWAHYTAHSYLLLSLLDHFYNCPSNQLLNRIIIKYHLPFHTPGARRAYLFLILGIRMKVPSLKYLLTHTHCTRLGVQWWTRLSQCPHGVLRSVSNYRKEISYTWELQSFCLILKIRKYDTMWCHLIL